MTQIDTIYRSSFHSLKAFSEIAGSWESGRTGPPPEFTTQLHDYISKLDRHNSLRAELSAALSTCPDQSISLRFVDSVHGFRREMCTAYQAPLRHVDTANCLAATCRQTTDQSLLAVHEHEPK